ncbi:hypothetical protein DRO03_05180 [Methanosarcinales archaeon]|nr:MAG: hypothetical protein DRO03_05180 [Methanosarcinales archaeon]
MNGLYGEGIDSPYYWGRCRRFPWWAMPATPYTPPAPAAVPGYAPPVYAPPAWTEEQELAMLESQEAMLRERLEQIKKRLEEVKK